MTAHTAMLVQIVPRETLVSLALVFGKQAIVGAIQQAELADLAAEARWQNRVDQLGALPVPLEPVPDDRERRALARLMCEPSAGELGSRT